MRRPNCNERGQFLVFFALIIVSLLLILGASVDAGKLYFNWANLTRALDSACAAVVRKIPDGFSDTQVQSTAREVAIYNLQQQGADTNGFLFAAAVTRRPEFIELAKIQLTGTLQGIKTVFMKFIPGLETTKVSGMSTCPICYDNPDLFPITSTTVYEAGIECQRICNDGTLKIPGTDTCCPSYHTPIIPLVNAQCTCSEQVFIEQQTDGCDPLAEPPPNPAEPQDLEVDAPGDPEIEGNPDDPGITGPIWIDRLQSNQLALACADECRDRGFMTGNLVCNNDCREETGNVCCKCACTGDVQC